MIDRNGTSGELGAPSGRRYAFEIAIAPLFVIPNRVTDHYLGCVDRFTHYLVRLTSLLSGGYG